MSNERYTGGAYLDANPSWHEEDSEWKAEKICRLLRGAGEMPATVAEVGCGTGGILRALQRCLPQAVLSGYDIAPAAIHRAVQQHANERLSFYCEDIIHAGRTFDLLLCIDVFEHVEDAFGFLRSIRSLAPRIVFNIPLEIHLAGTLINHQLWTRRHFGHLHFYTAALALETLRECGYQVLAHTYPSRLAEVPRSVSEWLFWLPRKVGALINAELSARIFGGTSLLVLAGRATS